MKVIYIVFHRVIGLLMLVVINLYLGNVKRKGFIFTKYLIFIWILTVCPLKKRVIFRN